MAAMLSNTLSDVVFYSFGDYYYCDWSDLVAMFLDLFSVPHSKDLTWPLQVQPIFIWVPTPLMFKRGWDALMPHLTDADWAATTVAIFAERLRLIRDTKLSEAEKGLFSIRPSDLEQVAEPFSLFSVNWPFSEYGSSQWAMWLTWDVGSVAAYETGAVGVATFLYHYTGNSFDCPSMCMGSMFQNTLSQLANWLAVTNGASVADAVNINASEMQLRIAAAQVASLLRRCLLPAVVRQHRQLGFNRMTYLQTALQFGANTINNSSNSWILDTMTASLPQTCPALSALIGVQHTVWNQSLQSLLRRLEAARQNISNPEGLTVGLDTAVSLEAYLVSRIGVVEALLAEYPDAAERLRIVLSNSYSDQGLPPLLRIIRQGDSSSNSSSAEIGTAAGFKQQATIVMASDSYLGIRTDALLLESASAGSTNIVKLVLMGSTIQKPTRRSNAVSLSILFDQGSKLLQVDPQFHFVSKHLTTGLERALGIAACEAMGYDPSAFVLPLDQLAKGITDRNADLFDFAKYAMHPATKKKFPSKAIPGPRARPYGCREGLMETADTAASVFALLGLPDDKGDATAPPFSARSVWKLCERAHRDYFSFDPEMVSAATEAVIYGTISHFLKYQWGPCCDGKNAAADTPKYLVVGNSDHINGLSEVCLKLEARCVRDSNHHSDLDAIPGAQARWAASNPAGAAAAALESSMRDKRTGDDQNGDEAKRVRTDAVPLDWHTSAHMASKANGFHFGHLIYDLRDMERDAIKKGLIQEKFAPEINLFGLVVRKVCGNDKRIAEIKKFAPSAKVHFDGPIELMPQAVKELYKAINPALYKADSRGPPPGGASQRRDSKKTGRGGRGGRGRGRQAAGAVLALMPPAVTPTATATFTSGPPPARDPAAAEPAIAAQHALSPRAVSSQKPALSHLRLASSAPPPPGAQDGEEARTLEHRPWAVRAVDAIRAGTGNVYNGFTSPRKATGYLTFLMVSCLLADPAAPNFLLIGDKSGKLMSHLQRRGFRPLCVDPQGCQEPGLAYKGFAEDIAYSRRWRGAIISTPCDDDAWCGSQYFQVKKENGTHYWSLYLSVFCWCIPADAVLFEHPLTILVPMWRQSHQLVHPYYFGADDDGRCLKKTTLLWLRGWKLVRATNVMQGTPVDHKHAIMDFDPVSRTQRRSDFTWNMAEALVDQCNPDTIIEGAVQPDLAVELIILADNYAKKYGAAALPFGHSNMQGLFPPVVNYSPSQMHRKQIRADAEAACARPTPMWPPTRFAHPAGDGKVVNTSGLAAIDGLLCKRTSAVQDAARSVALPPTPDPTPAEAPAIDSVSLASYASDSEAETGEDAVYELRARLQAAQQLVEGLSHNNKSRARQGALTSSLHARGARVVEDQHKHWFSEAYAAATLSNVTPTLALHARSAVSPALPKHNSSAPGDAAVADALVKVEERGEHSASGDLPSARPPHSIPPRKRQAEPDTPAHGAQSPEVGRPNPRRLKVHFAPVPAAGPQAPERHTTLLQGAMKGAGATPQGAMPIVCGARMSTSCSARMSAPCSLPRGKQYPLAGTDMCESCTLCMETPCRRPHEPIMFTPA